MNKLQMAHEYAIALINSDCEMQFDKFIRLCWNYADAMQAEADKREKEESEKKRADIREMLKANNTFVEREGQHFDDVADIQKPYSSSEEWQPDWSQAPSWANWWVAIANSKGEISGGWFFSKEPEIGKGDGVSAYYDGGDSTLTGSFGYQGNWQDSLRKRPQ